MENPTVKAGLLPLYLKLYDDANPGGHDDFRNFIGGISSRLAACGISVVTPGVVFDAPHVQEAKRMFEEEDVSFIVLLHLCYSPSLLVADFLTELGLPLLLLDTTPEFTFDSMEENHLMRNHGIHGVMDLTSVLKSRGVDFAVVSGHPEDGVFEQKLKKTVSAFRAAALMKNQKLGITGKPFEGMGDFAIDFQRLNDSFGISVQEIEVERIAKESVAVPSADVNRQIEKDKEIWDTSKITEGDLSQAVRDYLALKNIISTEGITGYTMNFQHIGDGMPTPFYACSGLMSEGIGYGGEGDVLTASLGLPLNSLCAAAKFDEFFCADWKNDRILMSHMGETDSRFIKPESSPYLIAREAMLNPHKSVIYRFQAEPGEVTFVNISPTADGGYRMVAGLLDIVDTQVLDQILGPHYQVSTRMPVGEFLERYAKEGGGHHLYIAKGNILDRLAIFCGILKFDFRTFPKEA